MTKLSENEIDSFFTNGYLVIEDFLEASYCKDLMAHMAQIIASERDKIPEIVFSTADNRNQKEGYFIDSLDKIHFFLESRAVDAKGQLQQPIEQAINKVGHGLHVADPKFKALCADSRIKEIALQLGLAKVGLLQSMYIFKRSSLGDKIDWHQESSFLYLEDNNVIGFWFALEDATKENGCLQAIPSPDITPLHQRMIRVEGRSEIINYNQPEGDFHRSEYLEVKQGGLVLLHGRLPHSSGPNHSHLSRQAFALHVIDPTKKYSKNNWLQRPENQLPVI